MNDSQQTQTNAHHLTVDNFRTFLNLYTSNMSEVEKMKMELEAARFEVVQADKEISGIRLSLRDLASKQSGEDTTEDSNSLKISANKVRIRQRFDTFNNRSEITNVDAFSTGNWSAGSCKA